MNITIISEEHPKGLEVDWPTVPGTGDHIAFRYGGGTNQLTVERVEWHVEGDADLSSVRVYLTY